MTCRRATRPSLVLAIMLAAPTLGAQSQQVQRATFSEYASPVTTEYQATIGRPVTSGGLDFYDTDAFTPGARNVLGTWGSSASDPGAVNRPVNIGSSTAMFATLANERIDIRVAGGNLVTGQFTPFQLFSIDVAHLYSTAFAPSALAPINITFTGFVTGGGSVTQGFTIPVPPAVGGVTTPVLTTLTFDERFRSVTGVAWTQGSSVGTVHQFTNVVWGVVPEPSTWLLMVTGLGGLAAVHLRRRRPQIA